MDEETEKDLREKIEWLEDELDRANSERQSLHRELGSMRAIRDQYLVERDTLREELAGADHAIVQLRAQVETYLRTRCPKHAEEIERLRARLRRSEALVHLLREGLACGKLSGLLVRVIDFCRESEGE